MKNLFAYDFTNRTIVATKATLKKASNPTTDEYKVLIKMIEGQPTFRVVEKTIKNSGNKKTYKGLTLKMMISDKLGEDFFIRRGQKIELCIYKLSSGSNRTPLPTRSHSTAYF